MGFLSAYGLFLLKTLTLVLGVLFTVGGIAALSRKPKPKMEIISLNKQRAELKEQLLRTIKSPLKKNKKEKKQPLKKSVYVIDFQGDIQASEVDSLREGVTAALMVASKEDEIVIRLESPGGLVHAYGLAASQLQRIRESGIPLTVCIDKMAASGGYLMACVADKLIAAPFAIIGSIGVVAQLPNFHRWLKKNNIDIELLTAGDYKRTLTMFGENTEKGRQKFQEDLQAVHDAFKDYVFSNRTEIDINKIATGEHWLALDAIKLHLVDQLLTSDDYLNQQMQAAEVYQIRCPHKKSFMEKLLKPAKTLVTQNFMS